MSDPANFKNFLKAFWVGWFTKMSGPISVPLAIAGYYVTNNIAKELLWVTAFICLVAASFTVWKRERQALLATQSEIMKSKNLPARLQIEFDSSCVQMKTDQIATYS